MSKKKDKEKKEEAPPENAQAAGLPVTIHTQYIRDLSFENPLAPQSLAGGGPAPEMNINVGMDARKIPDENLENLYESVLNVRAEGKQGEQTVFLVELLYGVTCSIDKSVPEDNHHPILFIEMPRLVFPYVRQILSAVTMQGGLPPLMLAPVDFQALYMKRFAKEIEESQKEAEKGKKKKA